MKVSLKTGALAMALAVMPVSAMASEGDVERLAREGAEKFVEPWKL